MEILLPRQFTANAFFGILHAHLGSLESFPKSLTFNFAELTFIRPSGIVVLANLTNFLNQQGVKVFYKGMNINGQAVRYLDDSGFFVQQLGKRLITHSRPRSTTIPLIRLSNSEAFGWLDLTLLPWVSDKSGVPLTSLRELRVCMGEIINNIRDHTDAVNSSIFSQWYPREDRLLISIGDTGAGIPSTVRRVEPHLTDQEAILRACEDGFSSKSLPTNQGIGLYLLLQNVVENLGGRLDITSGRAGVNFQRGSNILNGVPYEVDGFCPGTLISIEVRTDRFDVEEDDATGEFIW